ncbi:MAG TPA: Arm DNA-binding domain-containing protein, partial [Alphaproteobacteria bacterium]|nr:Arm DNA-binding domain-containing protein [Alphaproteobacteria bacterium]
MPKLTRRTIEAAHPDAEREAWVWDDEMRGFGLRVMPRSRKSPDGVKSFVVQYRIGRRTRRLAFGRYPVMNAKVARMRARALLATVDDGKDPSQERKAEAKAETVTELVRRFMSEHVEAHLKLGTRREYRRLLGAAKDTDENGDRQRPGIAEKALGAFRVRDVARADITRLIHARSKTPTDANRLHAALRAMFNFAERIGVRPDGS